MATAEPYGDVWVTTVGGDTTYTVGTGGTWKIDDFSTTATFPFNATAAQLTMATKEELAQVLMALQVCVLCGAKECWVVCDLCKTAIVEVRNRMVSDMIDELRP